MASGLIILSFLFNTPCKIAAVICCSLFSYFSSPLVALGIIFLPAIFSSFVKVPLLFFCWSVWWFSLLSAALAILLLSFLFSVYVTVPLVFFCSIFFVLPGFAISRFFVYLLKVYAPKPNKRISKTTANIFSWICFLLISTTLFLSGCWSIASHTLFQTATPDNHLWRL